ncbi:MAG: helix-turn-helix domain-containing protein [Polynucleobacter sp.]|nr:helix-turn-helix domain-containing protein [Polynucleobacter sp.]
MIPSNTNTTASDDGRSYCLALGEVLDRIGDKWAVMVVGALSKGPMRFNALRRLIGGVSQRMLTITLRGLERDGLIQRTMYPTIPPRVEYQLTELGLTLIEPLRQLGDWAEKQLPSIMQARESFDARQASEASQPEPFTAP